MDKMKKYKGDVQWYLPNAKKPFYHSTVAISLTIKVLYDEYQDLRMVYNALNYDEDAKKIVKYYLDRNIYKINLV